jgi:serine/threonine protein kinase/Flp pilus assembly protein TadD
MSEKDRISRDRVIATETESSETSDPRRFPTLSSNDSAPIREIDPTANRSDSDAPLESDTLGVGSIINATIEHQSDPSRPGVLETERRNETEIVPTLGECRYFGSDRSVEAGDTIPPDPSSESARDEIHPVARLGELDSFTLNPAEKIRIQIEHAGYEMLGEIARGGMGVVYKGRDRDLDRDLAIKVLRDRHRDKPELSRRFIEEARIGGRLEHPGVVPVHEVGYLEDKRPYFTMKLVKGRTLAELLGERTSVEDDLPRFLTIFEQVCQTLAYAHARGVIHRDLKPANIMTGAFGEVQVMDWGLAKVIRRRNDSDFAPRSDDSRDASQSAEDDPENECESDSVHTRSSSRSSDESPLEPRDSLLGDAVETSIENEDDHSSSRVMMTDLRPSPGGMVDLSRPGTILGTPSYMAPEQARGEIDKMGPTADVFGLGAILCEILTGKPPYTGKTAYDIMRSAAEGQLTKVHERLATRPVDSELAEIMLKCLSFDPVNRPRDAGEVASAIVSYTNRVNERLKAAEHDRVEARARAIEEVKRRRLAVGLAATVIAATIAIVAGRLWVERRRTERIMNTRIAVYEVIANALELEARAKTSADDLAAWDHAAVIADHARSVFEAGEGDPDTRDRVWDMIARIQSEREEARNRVRRAKSDEKLQTEIERIRSSRGDDINPIDLDSEMIQVFNTYGINFASFERPGDGVEFDRATESLSERIRKMPEHFGLGISAALDDWALDLRTRGKPEHQWRRLIELARRCDGDPFRGQIRAAMLSKGSQGETLERIAAGAPLETLDKHGGYLLGVALRDAGLLDSAVRVLEAMQRRHPRDLWINAALGETLKRFQPPRWNEAIRYDMIVRSIRPELGHPLGRDLLELGSLDAAESLFRELTRLVPGNSGYHNGLGHTLVRLGKYDDAIAEFREALRFVPNSWDVHKNLAIAYLESEKLDLALAETRIAIELNPKVAPALFECAAGLRKKGKIEPAIVELSELVRLTPDDPDGWNVLGLFLIDEKRYDQAIEFYRRGIARYPKRFHLGLGIALRNRGDFELAYREIDEAVRNAPQKPDPHHHRGLTYLDRGMLDEAIAEFRLAIEREPTQKSRFWTLFQLGSTLSIREDYAGAAGAFREALAIDPNSAEARRLIGRNLEYQGKFLDALYELNKSYEELVVKKGDIIVSAPSRSWIEDLERLIRFEPRFEACLAGKDRPGDPLESMAFAELCLWKTKRPAAAARLYKKAFELSPDLADSMESSYRTFAARAAAAAACGRGDDAGEIDERSRGEFRNLALNWLEADLAYRLKQGSEKFKLEYDLTLKLNHPDFAPFRTPEKLAALPETERARWIAFWRNAEQAYRETIVANRKQKAF